MRDLSRTRTALGRRAVWLGVAVVFVAVGACGRGRAEPLGEIRALSQAQNFGNGQEAAGALATIGARAIELQRACLARRDGGERTSMECEAYGSLAAWAQVSAVAVARCGRADALETRAALVGLVDQVDATRQGTRSRRPDLPPTPSCP